MPEEPKSLIDDRERMERYLVWRDLDRRIRRRRLVRRVLVVAAVGVVGVGFAAWLWSGPQHTAWLWSGPQHTASLTAQTAPSPHDARPAERAAAQTVAPPEAASRSSAVGVTEDVRTVESEPAPPPVIERAPTPRAPKPTVRQSARVTSRPVERATAAAPVVVDEPVLPSAAPHYSSPPSPHTTPSDAAASADPVMPLDRATPAVTAPARDLTPPTTDSRSETAPRVDVPARTTPPAVAAAPPIANPPPVADTPTVPPAPPVVQTPPAVATPPVVQSPSRGATGTVTSIASKPDCSDLSGEPAPDGRTRSQRVSDCVGGWLKGQSREFRDGVTRGVDEVRGGIDKVGRGLQWLGDKLRRSE